MARIKWKGVLGVEGEMTGDGRFIEPGALRWEDLPLNIRAVKEDVGGHDGAVVVGRINSITREKNNIVAEGDFDGDSPEGVEAARQVKEDLVNGVSMDLDDVSFEIRVAAELLNQENAILEEGVEVTDEENPENETDADGRVTVMKINSGDEVMATTDARLRAATLVAIPAFSTAKIALQEVTEEAAEIGPDSEKLATGRDTGFANVLDDIEAEHAALIASAIPVKPPKAWFMDPMLPLASPIIVEEDGRFYGHIATWGTCHVGREGECVQPPNSPTDYAYFRTGAVLTKEGEQIPTGRITMGTRHAGEWLTANSTVAHYENTGMVMCDVAAGEDQFGIWVAGALRPNTSPEQIRELRAAPMSGDWRRIGNGLELVAVLAVNSGGFPIPRPAGLVASGEMQALVASGMLAPRKVRAPGTEGALSTDDLKYLKRLANKERTIVKKEIDTMATEVNTARAKKLAARVAATRTKGE